MCSSKSGYDQLVNEEASFSKRMSENIKLNSYGLLVKSSGNSLEVNENILERLKTLEQDNIPVVVLSVIGQPQSRKTSLMNYVLRVLSREENPPLFPLNSYDEAHRCEDFQGEEGILVYTPLQRTHGDSVFTWLLLDIWMENPRIGVYKKLVDFCLNMSSAVIFSELCKEEMPMIFWNPELSKLPQSSCSIQNSLQLHFLIEKDDYEGTSQSYFEGSPSEHNCNNGLSVELETVIKTYTIFRDRCFYTTSYIPVGQMELSPGNEKSIMSETLEQIMSTCAYNPLNINNEAINITNVGFWFEKCVDAINTAYSLPGTTQSTSIKTGMTSICQQDLTLFDRVISLHENPQNYRFDDDVEMKDLCARDTQINDGSSRNELSLSETLLDPLKQPQHSPVAKYNAQPLMNNEMAFENVSDRNELFLPAWLQQTCDEYLNAFESRLAEWVFVAEIDFIRQQKYILEGILLKVLPVNNWLKLEVEKHADQWISTMATMIQTYHKNYSKHFHGKLCVGEEEFDKLHEENLMSAKAAVKWEEFPRRKLNKLFEKITEHQIHDIRNSNIRIFEQELQISKEAYDYALFKFKSVMDDKLSSTTLSERELMIVYQRMSSATLELFLETLELPHSTPWVLEQQHLQETLKSLETIFVQKNKNHLKKVDLARKEAIEIGKQCYRDEMRKSLPVTKLTEEEFNNTSTSCYYMAIQMFHQKIRNNIHKNITKTWEDGVKIALDEIMSQLHKENEKKDDKKPNYLHTPQNMISHPQEVNCCGVCLYIDLQQVYVGLYLDRNTEHVFRMEHSIIIDSGEMFLGERPSSFMNDGQVGKSASCNTTVFGLLWENDGPWAVTIAGRPVTVGREELLPLYFRKIRTQIERLINQRVSSCFVAITALLASGVKQILKTSLSLAGFTNNYLISCTTLMAISYFRKFRNGDMKQKKHFNLFVYHCSDLVEVTSVNISDGRVKVINVCGDIIRGASDGKGLDRLKKIFFDAPPPYNNYKRIVFCNALKSFPDQNQLSCDKVLDIGRKFFCSSTPLNFDLKIDIIEVAALMDAVRNGHSQATIPVYNTIHPYKMFLQMNGKTKKFLDYNSNVTNVHMSINMRGKYALAIHEEAKAFSDHWNVRIYQLMYTPKETYPVEINIVLQEQGNLTVDVNPAGYRVSSNMKSITPNGREEISAVMKQFSEYSKTNVSTSEPSSSNTNQPNASSHGCGSDTQLEELQKSLTILIEKIQDELKISKFTSTAVRDNIVSKISKCQLLMKSSELKIKQLEIEKINLERAAKLIKS